MFDDAARAIAACASTLDRWDSLVFTGGVREHAAPVRDRICQRLLAVRGLPVRPSVPAMQQLAGSGLTTIVVAADEQAAMDRLVRPLLTGPPRDGDGAARGPAGRVIRRWPRWRAGLRWARRGGAVLLTLVILEYLVLPQVAGTRAALHILGSVRPAWVALGVVLEVLSLLSYSLLTRSVLPGPRPSFWWLLRTDLTGLGVGHIVPGGSAPAAAVRYHLLRQGGTPAPDAVVGATAEGVGSALVLVALLWVSLLLSIPVLGVHRLYVVVATVGAVVMAAAAVAVVGLTRGSTRVAGVVKHSTGWLPLRVRGRVEQTVSTAAEQVGLLLADRHRLRRSAVFATGNWVLDCAALWVFLAAFGWRADPLTLAVAYGVANVLAGLPITPGGLGLVEGSMIPLLVGFGSPRAEAVLGVVGWRLVEFWLPIPVAGLCYLSLRTQGWRDRGAIAGEWQIFRSLFGAHPHPLNPPPPQRAAHGRGLTPQGARRSGGAPTAPKVPEI